MIGRVSMAKMKEYAKGMENIPCGPTKIFADGLCEPNPGTATWAFVVFVNDKEYYSESGVLGGHRTNNEAEYMAVLKAVEWLQKNIQFLSVNQFFNIHTDSQLVVNQVTGDWACNKESLSGMRDQIYNKLCSLDTIGLDWIPSAENKADELTRVAYEKHTGIYPELRSNDPTEKQLTYLRALGCPEVPTTKKQASKLIEQWKR